MIVIVSLGGSDSLRLCLDLYVADRTLERATVLFIQASVATENSASALSNTEVLVAGFASMLLQPETTEKSYFTPEIDIDHR